MSPSPSLLRLSAPLLPVYAALLPGTAVLTLLYGPGVLLNLLLAIGSAITAEALCLRLRARPFTALGDGSALLTGWLLALALPPDLPPGLPVLAAFSAIALGKQAYGGHGHNPFNPAMVGYLVVLLSAPAALASWPAPNLVWAADAQTHATTLDHVRSGLSQSQTLSELLDGPGGTWRGQLWAALAFGAGGLALLWQRRIRWQIPLGLLLGLGLPALVAWGFDSDRYASPLFQWLAGGTLLAAFFVATDPVTSARTPCGALAFGFGIGLIAWLIRSVGGYPDGLAFGVLLMNLTVPALDRWGSPR